MLSRVQAVLDFKHWENSQFQSKKGLGCVGLSGFLLGVVLGGHLVGGLVLLAVGKGRAAVFQWIIYVVFLTGFHFMEFFTTALFKPETVNYDSFVINQSEAYTIAAVASWTEFGLECLLAPSLKGRPAVITGGTLLVVVGQVFRSLAMCTAGSNFNHQIMERRETNHQLVTHGVYSILRHPSYFGWFWWCIGTQILLGNPLCVLAYSCAAWDFFRRRIPYEEATLAEFYPNQYPAYMERTWIGIPCIPSMPLRVKRKAS